ncbi:hypothetical protein M3Y94_00262100 [Aphelenchoides besseyi]|nr:hypothetical protein M3Y94_00262100 [Aphelenchoides besseyi]
MRSNLFIFATIFVLLTTQIGATDPKTSCVNKFLKFFSTFFSSQQVGSYADAAIGQVVKKANSSDIVDAVLKTALKSLTTSQYAKGSSLILSATSKFGSLANINSTIQKCINGAAPTLLKLYPKVTKKIQQTNGDKTTTAYQFANKKFTLKLSKNLVKKCKSKLSNDEWSKGTSLLKSYINFDVLGFSV